MPFSYYSSEDQKLEDMLPFYSLWKGEDPLTLEKIPAIRTYDVIRPDEEYAFLHEAAVIEYHGILFAAWYNNTRTELHGRTPIRARCSADGGKTWGEVQVVADDPTGKILYCPPVFGVDNDTLYMFQNQMVAPDHIHSLDLYRYDAEACKFVLLWSKPIPFKLNTNVVSLPNGKLMLPGRIAELDQFPNTPAVLISDSGRIDAEWRLVYIVPNGDLPDGSKLVHPELSAIVEGEEVTIFCRDDERRVPLLYRSTDSGETWSGPYAIDLPISSSKIYSGTLSDGREYIVTNVVPPDRKILVLYLTDCKGELHFTRAIELQNSLSDTLGYGGAWHYPVAHEADGKLYIIYTASNPDNTRGAVLTVVPLDEI